MHEDQTQLDLNDNTPLLSDDIDAVNEEVARLQAEAAVTTHSDVLDGEIELLRTAANLHAAQQPTPVEVPE